MQVLKILVIISITVEIAACKSVATDQQIDQMCEKKLEITGVLRGTSYEDESKRISDEYQTKESKLKNEMDRDLRGLDDVLALKIKDMGGDAAPAAKVNAAKEDIAKKKQAIVEQFEPLIEKLQPQKSYALKSAKEYTDKRAAEAQKAKADCLEDSKKNRIKEETALCRIQADSPDKYNSCP